MGDYEFLCNMYGISGASGMLFDNTKFYIEIKIEIYTGIIMEIFHFEKIFKIVESCVKVFLNFVFLSGRHCCLFCSSTKDNFQKHLENTEKRSLATLDKSLEKFVEFGCDLNRAKECNNVINQRIFNIPLNQVCAQFVKYT